MKYKKLVSLVIVLLFTFTFAFADVDTSGMTQTQLQQYYRQMLSVSERVVTTSNAYGGAWKTSSTTAFGYSTGVSSSSLTWDAYRGPNQISKYEFFKTAEETKLANECKLIEERIEKKHSEGMTWTVIGGAGVGIGMIVMLANLGNLESETGIIAGGIISLISCIPLGIGVSELQYSEEPNVSASFAIGIADIYNHKLAAIIKAKY